MRAVAQLVTSASVEVEGTTVAAIDTGLLVLLGVHKSDVDSDVDYVARKILGLRVFPDDDGRMNRSVVDVGGALLVVSQFTLYADTRKGRRPGFDAAAEPDRATALYESFVARVATTVPVHTGRFGAKMAVTCTNHGPVTIIVDSADPSLQKEF